MTQKTFGDLTENYVALGRAGDLQTLAGGDDFWSLPGEKLDEIGESWLVTEFYFDADWPTWEMHPHGEELVYLLSGEMDLILEKDGERRQIELRGKGVVVVPQNTWHTAKVRVPGNMLIVTRGKGTAVRPVE